jgi:hypothetical protein
MASNTRRLRCCPVCSSESLKPSNRQNVIHRDNPDDLAADVLSYRCENGHVFVISSPWPAAND